jgi:group I intron endonuclease
MPYAQDFCGVYRIVDAFTGHCYVGQSRRVRKRIGEHFRLLRHGIHPNEHMQTAFNVAPEGAFQAEIEAYFEDPADMDLVEEAFLQGEAKFDDSPHLFNISSTARAPMENRNHTDKTKAQISRAKRGRTDHVTAEYREKLAAVSRRRRLQDLEFVAKVKFLVQNTHLSYAERGRRVGLDTSSARKLALKYANDQEFLNG